MLIEYFIQKLTKTICFPMLSKYDFKRDNIAKYLHIGYFVVSCKRVIKGTKILAKIKRTHSKDKDQTR